MLGLHLCSSYFQSRVTVAVAFGEWETFVSQDSHLHFGFLDVQV